MAAIYLKGALHYGILVSLVASVGGCGSVTAFRTDSRLVHAVRCCSMMGKVFVRMRKPSLDSNLELCREHVEEFGCVKNLKLLCMDYFIIFNFLLCPPILCVLARAFLFYFLFYFIKHIIIHSAIAFLHSCNNYDSFVILSVCLSVRMSLSVSPHPSLSTRPGLCMDYFIIFNFLPVSVSVLQFCACLRALFYFIFYFILLNILLSILLSLSFTRVIIMTLS